VRRVKNEKPSVHRVYGDEIREFRELRRQFPESTFVLCHRTRRPFTTDAVNRLIKRVGERAGFDFPRACPERTQEAQVYYCRVGTDREGRADGLP